MKYFIISLVHSFSTNKFDNSAIDQFVLVVQSLLKQPDLLFHEPIIYSIF